MAKSDDSYLVCLRVTTTSHVVPGSMKKRCSDCDHRVWVSPASWKVSLRKKLAILCMQCAKKRAAKDDDLEIQFPTKEQRAEIRAATQKDVTKEDWKELQEAIKKDMTADEWTEFQDAVKKGITEEDWKELQESMRKDALEAQMRKLREVIQRKIIERN
jgi:hypothetical protein